MAAARIPPRWREVLEDGVVLFVFLVAFPKLARWPTRLRPRGLAAYFAVITALGFALRSWALPCFKRMAEEQDRAKQQLREQLGRDPTEDELIAHLGVARRR